MEELYNIKIIILFVVCAILLSGCDETTKNSTVTSEKESSSVCIIEGEDDSLMNLSLEEFVNKYRKLPDDYRIKVNSENLILIDKDDKRVYVDESGTITKKQADQIEEIRNKKSDINWDSFSLKGLRYFKNLLRIDLYRFKFTNTSELKYCYRLSEITFRNCNLTDINF